MPQQLIFINGPTISSSASTEERRLIRSQIASRCRTTPVSELPAKHSDDTSGHMSAAASYVGQDEFQHGGEHENEQEVEIWTPVSGVQFEPCPESGAAFFDRRTREAIDYRLRVILPDFRQHGHYAEKYFRALVLEAKNKPLAISATILNSLVHRNTTRLDRGQHTMEIRAARHKLIQLVREGIMKDYRLPDLLSSILILATTEPATSLPSPKDVNPFTPLSLGSQWLEVYINKPISQVHWQALETLIRLHGGIYNLKTYGSAWQVSLTGLMKSAQTVTPPPYPLVSPEGHRFPDLSPAQYLGIQDTPARVSAPGGFSLLRSGNIKISVLRRFTAIREFVWVMENLSSSQSQSFHRDTLMDCRNLIQHRLLSLLDDSDAKSSPWAASSTDIPHREDIYKACLSTALLFTIHVIFPLPASSHPRTILLDRLLAALSSVDIIEEILLTGWAEMSLWCAFIGGIAALNTDKRGYFALKIKETALACGLESWAQVRPELERFIWLGPACDARALELWREACSFLEDAEEGVGESMVM